MTVLPIVARELRVAARRWSTYVLRVGAATSAIALATLVYFFVSRDLSAPPATMGKVIFVVLSGFAFLYALLFGVRVSSDCLSSEKREGTLGLLFLTDLKGLDIVLGKLAASALDAFYALIGTLPVLAIPILLGSVTAGEIWRTMLCLLCTALFSVCAGIVVSSLSLSERKAATGTFLLVAFVAAGIPAAVLLIGAYASWGEPFEWLLTLSPATSIVAALTNNPGEIPWGMYWASIAFTLGYVLAFTGIAAWVVPRIWQQRVETGGRRNWMTPGGDRRAARAHRQQLLDVSPTCWLAGRGRLRGLWLWLFLGVVLAAWLWAYSEDETGMLSLPMSLAWMFFVHGVIKVFVASEAVRTYMEDHRQGALELILCTPLSVSEIIRGQWLNLVRYFRGPVTVLLAVDVCLLLAGRSVGDYAASSSSVVPWFVALMIFFVLDCAVIGVVGLWQGLSGRNSRQALTAAMVRILVLPWILYGLANLVASLVLRTDIPERLQLPVWIAISLAVNALFGWRAWAQLHRNLRAIAAARHGNPLPSGWWSRLGRAYGRLTAPRRPSAQAG